MNNHKATRFLDECGRNDASQEDLLDDLGGDPLELSGFESEAPEGDFDERS